MDKKTYNNLLVSSAPHIVTNMDTTRIMMMVLIGLAPSFLVSIYVFGARVISLTLVCAVASVFFEWAWNKLMHKRQTIGDLSAVLTGVLIAFNVPSGLPYWIAIVGCFVAIIVIKQLFGGVGKNRSRAVDEINILAAEIFDRIYNLLCEDSGDIWCHNKNSCKLLAGCFALFFLGVHFFISKIDVVVK